MRPPTRSRWPAGLLGMIAIVATVETTLARHPARFADTASLSWTLAFGAVADDANRPEVACLGDSLVKIGVIPEVVRADSGRTTYNFAMAQAPSPATYFLLRRLVEAGARPSAVVVDFKPSILAGGPRFSLRRWQSVLGLREAVELAGDARSAGLLVEILLGRVLPSWRDRLEVREAIRSALLGVPAPTASTNRLALRNWTINRGAHLNSARLAFSGEVRAEVHRNVGSDAWKCHPINAEYVDRFFALAEAHGLPAFWLLPPLSPALQARRERSGVEAAYLAFVRSIRSKHPGLTIIDGRHSSYDDATFADHAHLNGRGSIALSRDLAAILASPGAGGRRVDLPKFADRPGSYPVEYVDQSRLALEAEATRR